MEREKILESILELLLMVNDDDYYKFSGIKLAGEIGDNIYNVQCWYTTNILAWYEENLMSDIAKKFISYPLV